MKRLKKLDRRLVIGAIGVLIFIGLVQHVYLLISDDIVAFIQAKSGLSIVIYTLYTSISVMILSLPLIPLWPIIYDSYGFGPSVVATFIGVMVGGMINFYLTRKYGRPFILKRISEKDMDKLERITQIDKLRTFIFIRLIANNYFDAVSYLSGLSKIRFSFYFIGTLVASLIWVPVSFLAISQANHLSEKFSLIILGILYFAIALLGLGVLNKYLRKKEK